MAEQHKDLCIATGTLQIPVVPGLFDPILPRRLSLGRKSGDLTKDGDPTKEYETKNRYRRISSLLTNHCASADAMGVLTACRYEIHSLLIYWNGILVHIHI